MDTESMGSRGIQVEAMVLHPEGVQVGQEVRGVREVRETHSEARQEWRTVVEVQARQEGQESVVSGMAGVMDPRMEVGCLRPVVQALGQLHQRREQEGLRTEQGSGEHNLRNEGPGMEHLRKGGMDNRGTARRRGQHSGPVRLEAPGTGGL
jgi:hypothetical protein